MKVLSIHQPWAWAIAEGLKRVENRSWETKHRGPLLIQASKRWSRSEVEALLAELDGRGLLPRVPTLTELEAQCGHVIARVELTGLRRVGEGDPDPWAIPGHVAFELEEAVLLEPLAVTGQQRLFNLPAELEARLVPRVAARPTRSLVDELLDEGLVAPSSRRARSEADERLRGYERGVAHLAALKRDLARLEREKKDLGADIKAKKKELNDTIESLACGQLDLGFGGPR